jgi:NAD-dependent dihydropyrimidine dehydrogenase PreA subunit
VNEQPATSNEQLHGVFIDVEVDDSAANDAELAKRLEEACPVDIFSAEGGRVGLVRENLDECVLCNLCVDASPPDTVRIIKLYEH